MKLVITIVVTAGVLCACTGKTGGDAVAAESSVEPVASSTTAPPASATASSTSEPGRPDMPAFGVVETTRRPLGPDAQTCETPERPAGAHEVSFVQGSKPGTPVVTIMVPEAWTTAVAQDDTTMTLTGPGALTGTVTVSPTELGPAEAFEKYSDDVTATAPISSVSVLPGELCGYSGQKLMGMLSGGEGPPIEYEDRVAHVWTNGPSYLVAIHVEGPQGDAALSAASDVILGDFGIRIP